MSHDGILKAARRLARAKRLFSMDQLALEAGVSRATLYRRFRSREAVLEALGVDTGLPATRHAHLVQTAAKIVTREGLSALTLRRVAREAQVSLPTVQRNFRGRVGLLQAVAEVHGARSQARALALGDLDAPVEESLSAFAAQALTAYRASAPLIRALFTAEGASSSERRAAEATKGSLHALATYFAAQQRRGGLRTNEDPAWLAQSFGLQLALWGVFALELLPGRTEPLHTLARRLTRLFLQGAAR